MKEIWFDVACSDGDKIWCVSYSGGLFEINIKDKRIFFLDVISEDCGTYYSRVALMCYAQNTLILAPCQNGKFWKFNIQTGSLECISENRNKSTYTTYYQDLDKIIFFSDDGKTLAKYDLNTSEFVTIEMINFPNERIGGRIKGMILGGSLKEYDGFLYHVIYGTNLIIKIKANDFKIREIIELNDIQSLALVYCFENVFYFVTTAGLIFKGDLYGRHIEVLLPAGTGAVIGGSAFSSWINLGSEIILLPCFGKMILKCSGNEISKLYAIENEFNELNRIGVISAIIIDKGRIATFDTSDNKLLIIDVKTNKGEKIALERDKTSFARYFRKKNLLIEGDEDVTIKEFLDFMLKGQ